MHKEGKEKGYHFNCTCTYKDMQVKIHLLKMVLIK